MIDLGWLGYIEFSWKFVLAVGSIVLIDLVLAGDNAVVIAMAVKNLKGKKRTGIDLMRFRAMYIHTVRAYF